MPYELADDEVAFIIRPINTDDMDDWDGSVGTGIAVGDNFCYSDDVLQDLVYVATLCSAFLDLIEKDDEIFDRVSDHRYEIMMKQINKHSKGDKPLQDSKGKVINFNEYTKTKGNA
tara:strand:- start:42 stop:389 length:348 start_codon:yes stop_codon:yes gene_type:complete